MKHLPVDEHNLLTVVALVCSAAAAAILPFYLLRRPALVRATKLWLLFGLGVLPIGAALGANVQGYKATQHREFCGSCHVMGPHAKDSEDPNSKSLAAIHARSPFFGKDNCYTCHADYGAFGTVMTKAGGMRHVYLYLTEFRKMDLEEAKHKIHLIKPFQNSNCMQCHTTNAPGWLRIPDHASAKSAVLTNEVGCSSKGCHGVAHPLTKLPGEDRPEPVKVKPAPSSALSNMGNTK
ncbi:MAG: NapC/NirT family cytochrome c [Myxococcales bacterium]|nr:NapC/NirT family cytochrome c [Myxococcales bacterium]